MHMLNKNAAIDFQPSNLLIMRFIKEYDVSETEARERFQETKKFLLLCSTDRNTAFVPSKKIDVMWHQFILNSRDYFCFCELLGGYVHHQPSEMPQPEGYEKTLEGLRKVFGELNPNYWNEKFAEDEDCSSSDCSCCP
jgi:hypothetical protein